MSIIYEENCVDGPGGFMGICDGTGSNPCTVADLYGSGFPHSKFCFLATSTYSPVITPSAVPSYKEISHIPTVKSSYVPSG